jgi:NAD(P) transhydrogenase subunit beta
MAWLPGAIQACYFLAALLFILGLKRMSSPRTARGGIVWAGVGMALAVAATFALPGLAHRGLMLAALLLGTIAAWWSGRRVAASYGLAWAWRWRWRPPSRCPGWRIVG